MGRPAKITIDLSALRNNFQQVRNLAPGCSILAMVKSNAYGHGLTRIALALPEAEALGVACLDEGMQLRDAGVKNDIVLMEGLFDEAEIAKANNGKFTLVVHHQAQIDMLEKTKYQFPIWLKIDTGMHRLGFSPSAIKKIHQRLSKCSAVKKPIGLMTHFAESDSLEREHTLKQIELFKEATENLPGPYSLANSAGIIAWPTAHADWVRPGIMLYGTSPFRGHRGIEHHLQPVMSLTSEIIAIHHLKKGDRVGYGGTWTCPEDTKIGVVGIGYGDGYPRHAKNGTPTLVNGRHCPLIGLVAMDMLTVDLRSQPEAKVGDPVVLWGAGLPVEVVAEHSDTTGYELLTRITQRVRVFVQEQTHPSIASNSP